MNGSVTLYPDDGPAVEVKVLRRTDVVVWVHWPESGYADEFGRVAAPVQWLKPRSQREPQSERRSQPMAHRVAELRREGLAPHEVKTRLGITTYQYESAHSHARRMGLL